LPQSSKSINENTLSKFTVFNEGKARMPLLKVPTNLDPTFSSQGIMYVVMLLVQRFELDFTELLSVLVSYDYSPECHYYFICAAMMLMVHGYPRHNGRRKGFEFGFYFHHIVKAFYCSERSGGGINKITKMFSRRNANDLETSCNYNFHEFKSIVERRFVLMLWISNNHRSKPTTKKGTKSIYEKILQKHTHGAKEVGELCGGHGVTLMAILGFYPEWLISYRSYKGTSYSAKYFSTKYDINNTTVTDAGSFFYSVLHALNTRQNKNYDENELEQVLCKVSRILSSESHSNRHAIWCVPGQILMNFYNRNRIGDRIPIILLPDGSKKLLDGKCIFPKFTVMNNGMKQNLSTFDICKLQCVKKFFPGTVYRENEFESCVVRVRKGYLMRRLFERCPTKIGFHVPLPDESFFNDVLRCNYQHIKDTADASYSRERKN
jgi:hypothetical protein